MSATPTKPERTICLWSGPRNVSTALMYSFAQRSDTEVVDEPLYAHYLHASGASHPARDTVLARMDRDGNAIMSRLLEGPRRRSVLFLKQMAHHLVDIDRSFLRQTVSVLLIRDPRDVLPSLVKQLPKPTLADIGLAVQCELYATLAAGGDPPAVLDSARLLRDPRGVLEALCARIGLPFEPSMLAWPAGAKPYDGVWAAHWYQNVHRSTGFEAYRPKSAPLPVALAPLLERCRPLYEELATHAIGAG